MHTMDGAHYGQYLVQLIIATKISIMQLQHYVEILLLDLEAITKQTGSLRLVQDG